MSTGEPQFLGTVRLADLPTIAAPAEPYPIPIQRLDELEAAEIEADAPPPVGNFSGPPPFTVTLGFTAMTFANASGAPPDVSVAVGQNHVVETINTAMAVYNKSGALVAGPVSLNTFFSTAPFSGFDPKVLYDPLADRFFVVMVGIDSTSTPQRGRNYVAVSQTNDPTGAWFTFILTTQSGSFPDYPGFGTRSDKVIVTSNDFPLPSGSFLGSQIWVIDKALMMTGTLSFQNFGRDTTVGTIQPAESQTPTTNHFMVGLSTSSFGQLEFFDVTGLPPLVAIARTTLAMNDASIPPDANQAGTSVLIDTGDARFQRCTWRNGRLWASSTGSCIPPGDSTARSCPRFTEILTTGVPVINQDFSYALNTFGFYYPAIQTDPFGNLAVVFTRSSTAEFPGLYFAGRLFTDPNNTISSPGLLKAGERFYQCTFCGSRNRWGDYSGAAVDPADGSLWVAGEYMGSPTSNDYATFIARLVLTEPATTTTSSTTTTSTTSTTTSTTSTTTSTTSTTTTPPRGVRWPNLVHEISL